MTALVYLVACMLIGHAAADVVELSCSDNATCIENMMKDFARSIRQKKTVRLFDTFEIEPLQTEQSRANQGALSKFLETHSFSYDWEDYTFKVASSQNRPDALDLEVWESRTAKDVSEPVPKKSKSKVEHGEDEDKKSPKRRRPINRRGRTSRQLLEISITTDGLKHKLVSNDIDNFVDKIDKPPKKNKVFVPPKFVASHTGRRQKKKVLQAVIPLLFGMKSTGAVLIALAVVTVLVMKAFVASKLALMVTVGMAVRRLYDSYSNGVGLQNHPYLYSQYPIDFPSASSHAYSVSGVSPQFGTPEMYNPTGLASQMIQSNDVSAQQSQQAPTVQLVNATRAAERWDGKSLIQRFLGPIVNGFKTIINPIANVVYDAMPATFRGLNTEVSTSKTYESEPLLAEESIIKTKEILVPQPRNIAQRKMNYRSVMTTRPKKYVELKVDLNKLKQNKDFHDYIKTKKYQHNYLNTYYYPRVKYFVNPHTFVLRPNNNRLVSYPKVSQTPIRPLSKNVTAKSNLTTTNYTKEIKTTDWKPIVVLNTTDLIPKLINTTSTFPNKQNPKPFTTINRNRKRTIRDLTYITSPRSKNDYNSNSDDDFDFIYSTSRGIIDWFESFFGKETVNQYAETFLKQVTTYTKSVIKENLHLKEDKPPVYYTAAYELIMMSLDMIDGLVGVQSAIEDHVTETKIVKKVSKKKKRRKNNKKKDSEETVTTTTEIAAKKNKRRKM